MLKGASLFWFLWKMSVFAAAGAAHCYQVRSSEEEKSDVTGENSRLKNK